MARRELTRDQAQSWNEAWSYTDRETIRQHFERLQPRTFYVPPSGGYVGCRDEAGIVVMRLYAGYLEFKTDLAPDDRPEPDWPGLLLSTFRPHASPTPQIEDDSGVCPTHHIALPTSGVCDECS